MREIRSFSLIFADFCRFSLFLGITAFRGRRFSQKTETAGASQERVSGFPEKGADLRGSPGTSGEVWGTSGRFGKLPGSLWIAVKFHSERTSGEVAEKLPGKFGELPGKSGDFPEARGSLTPSQRLAKIVSKSRVHAKGVVLSERACFGLLSWSAANGGLRDGGSRKSEDI